MVFDNFHPAVASWFQQEFKRPTEIQEQSWPEIQQQRNTLIAAPTGSGKTLAAFLATIDQLIQKGLKGQWQPGTQVLYVSPLKALSNDIEKNLQIPLKGISEKLLEQGLPQVDIKVWVRTGDTPQSERAAMAKNPPDIIVTTPESLYLLLTSDSGRRALSTVHTVIVDEIHALVGDKRGSHLSLSLERLEALTPQPLTRIGISATQKPMERVAAFLAGFDKKGKQRPCSIVDTGHKRKLDLSIELPDSPMTAIMSNEVWGEVYNTLEKLILSHKTTLLFVNTRRLAERLAAQLTDRLGEETIATHHGSMSKEKRLDAEQKLKAGELKAIVATASLELGIDIGNVDLVCQIGTPKAIATFLQRVGRSGHTIAGTPKGKIFPLTRDELVESVALIDAVRRGELDEMLIPYQPIDILAQQIVAEIGAREWEEDALYELIKGAYPYREIEKVLYTKVIRMLSDGFTTRRGRRSAYLHYDMINKRLRARKGARLTALVNGGAIPDNFDYDVILEPAGIFVGTLDEDFSSESMPGDIFQLGNYSYRILRVETGKVRVEDAHGLPPTLPVWFGEGPGRTKEFSYAVSRLREEVSERIGDLEDIKRDEEYKVESAAIPYKKKAIDWLTKEVGVDTISADQVVTYLATAKAALGVMPTQKNIVLERFFDEAGDMHLVVHSPFGSRMNRGWGLSLRKRFCRKFNFELQATATEDAIVLSLGATHSFPLKEVFDYLKSQSVRNVLIQAMLDSPIFEVRWRWNAGRALAVQRRRAGKKVPPQLQRMQAEDLVALLFPDQLACLENIAGEREVPDHPLVDQTIHDCLTEAMDIENLEELLKEIEAGERNLVAKDLREPSALAQEILVAKPYAFLDGGEAIERRTRAVANRRWIDPAEAKELGQLDIEAIEQVKEEAWPQVADMDELHDALVLLGYATKEEGEASNWDVMFEQLVKEGRAVRFNPGEQELWIAIERIPQILSIYSSTSGKVGSSEPPRLTGTPPFKGGELKGGELKGVTLPSQLQEEEWEADKALVEIVRGRLEGLGPVYAADLVASMSLEQSVIDMALLALENEGFAFRGQFTPANTEYEEWCDRRLLARIHRYTISRLRKEIEPVSAADFMCFLFDWHHIGVADLPEGVEALKNVLDQLEGYEAPAGAWEGAILPARLDNYDFNWLDMLCLSGRTLWGRFRLAENNNGKKGVSPIKSTPILLTTRQNLSLWLKRDNDEQAFSSHTQKVYDYMKKSGAVFFDDIGVNTGLLNTQVEEALSELVAKGFVTSDSFSGLRALLVPAKYRSSDKNRRRKKEPAFKMESAGRWTVIHPVQQQNEKADPYEKLVKILLKRYGVVFRKLVEGEKNMPSWRELVRVFRRMEAKGEIRGGRFVAGVWGEQFALPEVVSQLRAVKKKEKDNQLIAISAADPLNLQGIITPGRKVPALTTNRILYRDGIPVAVLEGGDVKFLKEPESEEKWGLKNALINRNIPTNLMAYLGKGIV